MAKVRVRTFRGYADFESIREAQEEAKNMILDIITDGFDSSYWWAQVFWYEKKVFRTWRCPEIGLWSYTRWDKINDWLLDLYCS